MELFPLIFIEKEAEAILLDLRAGRIQENKEIIKVNKEILLEIWEAKQLGLKGCQPEAKGEVCNICAYKKFCSNYTKSGPKEEKLDEVAKPLPLICSKGLLEIGYDLDFYSIRNYVYPFIQDSVNQLNSFNGMLENIPNNIKKDFSILSKNKKKQLIEWIMNKFNLNYNEAIKLIEEPYSEKDFDQSKKILKEMSAEIEPWKRIFKGKILKEKIPYALGIAKSTSALPRKSSKLIKKAWKKWI
jgi:hypothetical protein